MNLGELIQKLQELEKQYGPTLPVRYHTIAENCLERDRVDTVDFAMLEQDSKFGLHIKLI